MSGLAEMASDLLSKEGKPAYVEFSTIAKHLPTRSEREGRYISIDVDVVTVRQIGAADSVVFEVDRWLKQNKIDAMNQRLPKAHVDHYERMYKAWKDGQEMPVEGTPIKGWAVIPPSQAETIIRAGIRTVEDLAKMNAEAMQRIGMGAVMLKNKAMAWVEQAEDKGPLTIKMGNLQAENELLKLNLSKLTDQVELLLAEKPKAQKSTRQVDAIPDEGVISLADITDEEPVKRGPGRPRKEA